MVVGSYEIPGQLKPEEKNPNKPVEKNVRLTLFQIYQTTEKSSYNTNPLIKYLDAKKILIDETFDKSHKSDYI